MKPFPVLGQLGRIGCSPCQLLFDSMDDLKLHFISTPEVHNATCPDCLQDFHSLRGIQVRLSYIYRRPQTGNTPALFQNHITVTHRDEQIPPPSAPTLATGQAVKVCPEQPRATTQAFTASRRRPTERRAFNVAKRRGRPRQQQSRSDGMHVAPRQISLADFPDSDSEDVASSESIDDEDRAALDAWGLRPRHNTSPTAVVLSDRSHFKPLHASSAPRMPSLNIQCPICFETAVDAMSTPCGHVGCGPVGWTRGPLAASDISFRQCIHRSLEHGPFCPMCRHPTKMSDLRPIYL